MAGGVQDEVVDGFVDQFVDELIRHCGEEHRETFKAMAADARRSALRGAALEHEIASRRAASLAAFARAYGDRLGALPADLEERISWMDRRALDFAVVLVGASRDAEEFAAHLSAFEDMCREERRRGGGRVLAEILTRRFGHPIAYSYDDLFRIASVDQLNRCFARLENATTAEEVVEPVLDMLDDRVSSVSGS